MIDIMKCLVALSKYVFMLNLLYSTCDLVGLFCYPECSYRLKQ